MRDRRRILDNLENLYRDELDRSAESEGADGGRLDFEFQRDQLYLEVLLDLGESVRMEQVFHQVLIVPSAVSFQLLSRRPEPRPSHQVSGQS